MPLVGQKPILVLPAYLVGMVMAPFFLANRTLTHRMRVTAFTFLTPSFFLKAGSLIKLSALWEGALLIGIFLAIRIATKFAGIWPAMEIFKFTRKENMYTTLLMSTGLTFGTISALFGYTNKIIDQEQDTMLVTADSVCGGPHGHRAEVVPAGNEGGDTGCLKNPHRQ